MKARYLMHEFINCPPILSPISQFPLNMYEITEKNPGKLQVIDMSLHPEQTMQSNKIMDKNSTYSEAYVLFFPPGKKQL